MKQPASGLEKSARIVLGMALAGLVVGVATFAFVRHTTVQHATERMHLPAVGGTCLFISLIGVLAAVSVGSRTRNRRTRTRRLAGVLASMILALPLAGWQWWLWRSGCGGVDEPACSPWPLYLWMALVAWTAWRFALLIRQFEIKRRMMWLVAIGGAALISGVHVSMQYELWDALSFGYHDIGLFARALHNAAEGRGLFMDSLGFVSLAEHAEFILYALVPAVLLGADPFHLLVFVSAISLALPALIVAWYVRRRFESNLAALIGAAAWLLLPSHGCLVIARGYGFHPAYLAVPLLVAGLACGFMRRWTPAVLCMLIACLAREEISLTVAAWGVYVAVADRRRVLGLGVAVIAAAYFCLAVFLVIPHFRGGPYPWISAHYNAQTTVGSVWGTIGTDAAFLATLLLPLAILARRPTLLLLVAAPALVETVLTTNPELHNLSVHYYTPIVPVLFMAAIRAWERSATPLRGGALSEQTDHAAFWGSRSARRLRGGWCLLASACLGQVYLGLGPQTNNPVRSMTSPELSRSIEGVRRVRAVLPRDLSVTASYRIAAHFTDFERLWVVANDEIGDVVIVDDRDNWDGSEPRRAIERAMRQGGYQPIWADYHLVALVKAEAPSPLALEINPRRVPDGLTATDVDIGEGIRLVGTRIDVGRVLPGGICDCRATLIWQCDAEGIGEDYRFGLTLGDDASRWGPFYFARGAYPTSAWQRGEMYCDDVRITIEADDVDRLSELSVSLLR